MRKEPVVVYERHEKNIFSVANKHKVKESLTNGNTETLAWL